MGFCFIHRSFENRLSDCPEILKCFLLWINGKIHIYWHLKYVFCFLNGIANRWCSNSSTHGWMDDSMAAWGVNIYIHTSTFGNDAEMMLQIIHFGSFSRSAAPMNGWCYKQSIMFWDSFLFLFSSSFEWNAINLLFCRLCLIWPL